MTLIRFSDRPFHRNPWAELDKMRRELDSWPRFLPGEARVLTGPSVFPAFNIFEDADNIYINAEIPGIAPDQAEVFFEGDTLTIRGERQPQLSDEQQVSFHRREIEYGSFSRSITLPIKIDIAGVKAKANNGIMEIILPKANEGKPRQINIEVS